MSMRQLWEGNDSAEWIRKISGKTKLIFLFLFSVLNIVIDHPQTLFLLFTVVLLLHLAAGTSWEKWQVLSVLLLLSLWGAMFSQALFFAQTPRTPLMVFLEPGDGWPGRITGGVCIYREGIIYGAVQGLRSASMLALGFLICWTSDPRQLLKALMDWKMPAQMAFMLVTAIRFLPILAAEAGEILLVLQLRSDSERGRHAVLCHIPHIAKPLLARCLRRSRTLALSVTSRGIFLDRQRERKEKWPWAERAVCLSLFAVVTGAAAGKILYLLSEQGMYFGCFRQIYDWTNLYL